MKKDIAMCKIVFFTVFLLLIPILLFASLNETLPSWHWAYDYINELRLRGCFEDLYSLNLPYTRGEVAGALNHTKTDIKEEKIRLCNSDLNLLNNLIVEFQDEICIIQEQVDEKGGYYQIGLRIQLDVNKHEDNKAKYRGIYRSKLGVSLGNQITAYNAINFNQYLVDDSLYVGKKWRGIVGYTEQGYVSAHISRFAFKFGRDFLRWGAGESGSLLFSDIARPLDQFTASAKLGPFRYTFLVSALDDMRLNPVPADSLGSTVVKRYISAHRLDVLFFRGKLQCAVTEAIVYGGINRQLDWVYINPFIFYHGAQLNKSGLGNTLGTLDVVYYPLRYWKVYGSLLIDDVQIEKISTGDLEPNEIGWLIGSKWADPFSISGLTLSGEYVRVTNRTYKTPNPWETFIHRNVTLGYPLGNDFDQWQVGISKWFMGSFWFKLGLSHTRKGEGGLYSAWDTPWMDYTVEEGYSEPFPTGIVEKLKQLSFSVRYYPSVYWGMKAEINYLLRKNAFHVEGETRNKTSWRIGVWFDGDVIIGLK